MKKVLFYLFILSSFFVNAQDEEYNDSLRINEIQTLGSHNSYKIMTEKCIHNLIKLAGPFTKGEFTPAQQMEYTHLPLDSQLENYGLRNFELDVYRDTAGGRYYHRQGMALCFKSTKSNVDALLWPGLKVLHISDIDFNTHYYTFKDALYAVKKWSDAHPSHIPIYILIETKEDGISDHVKIAGFKTAIRFDEDGMQEITNDINFIFKDDMQHILTPDNVRKNYASLNEAIQQNGWPKLKEARGKIVFIINGGMHITELLTKSYPSFQGLPYFSFTELDRPESAFIKCDNPNTDFEKIKQSVAKGYIVRTRGDADTEEARRNDYSSFNKAKTAGAQLISTDFYVPMKKTGYVLKKEMLLK
jgi:hypothetical protein